MEQFYKKKLLYKNHNIIMAVGFVPPFILVKFIVKQNDFPSEKQT